MARYLIDAYNLIHAALTSGGPAVDMTVRRLCQYLAANPSRAGVTLVLDGRPKPDEPSPNEFPEIDLVYSGAGVPADAVIARLVERAPDRKKLTVVSNDRAVVLHARAHYASAMSCEVFLRQIIESPGRRDGQSLPAHKLDGTPTAGELAHWLKEFGFEGDGEMKGTTLPTTKDQESLEGLNVEDLLGPRS